MYNFVCLPSRVLFTRLYNYNIRECRKIFTAATVTVPANPGDSKPFVTQATADHPTIALRDASAVQTVDSSEPTPGPLSCTSTSEQEQYPGKESSHLVASLSASKSGVQPSESFATSKMILEPITHLTSMLVQSKATVAKKKDKVSNLKKRQKEVEGFLSGKDEQIKQLENETEKMAAKLKEEIYQKEIELKQEKDDRQKTCEQLKKAQADLKAEKNEKKTLQKVLSAQSIQHLQEVVNRTTKEVESTREERETMKNILLWTDKDIHDEEDELAMEEQQRKITNKVTYFLLGIIIVLIAILVIL